MFQKQGSSDHDWTAISELVCFDISFTVFNRSLGLEALPTRVSFLLGVLVGVEPSLRVLLPRLCRSARPSTFSSEEDLIASLQLFLRLNLGDTARVVGS